ncbi:MAG: nucleotidyltransferase domain-containing protein [Acidobacteria bacterium]|nr:nucleotidyltransferase domain-containing protein [Acidobacteriota bacterium]
MDKVLQQLVDRMTKTFGDRLVSIVLYGSAAGGEYDGAFSDLNVMCVLRRITVAELRDSEPVFHWWRGQNNPSPLLLGEEEVRTSTDCFPIEFHDMKERRRVLYGADVVEPLEIDNSFYRAQVEHELRAKLLRLRQKAAGVMFDEELLRRLMAESVTTFLVLARHALRLAGHEAPFARPGILQQAATHFQLDAQPFQTLLEWRSNKQAPKGAPAVKLLETYLAQIDTLVAVVDAIAK